MTILGFLIPLALVMGLAGLYFFFWASRTGQFEDLDGAANRILIDEDGEG
ncbi:cbb3-type cytochrome oxidase assembly protein CcoS [Novosphingobium sp. P6W]|jgi:cbb3-type cytochrome oxidase maturation protein|nr:cbb3-type cytochrome oxidase assembly protein CcoS [Novosphingobium sp. P6W]AXB75095.1 cbb3-type cytochrome oxidase assembly protein CcoS [Novosphingobium sp. P6W]KIS30499.1 cytochrome oxidase maturation protein Cbb3 [Novosphingobium sp. P6W]